MRLDTIDVVEKNVFKHVGAHSDWTSTKWKEEEMPGTLQSLTFNFSVYLRVQISVSLREVTFTSC